MSLNSESLSGSNVELVSSMLLISISTEDDINLISSADALFISTLAAVTTEPTDDTTVNLVVSS